jgi:hypothetical protein
MEGGVGGGRRDGVGRIVYVVSKKGSREGLDCTAIGMMKRYIGPCDEPCDEWYEGPCKGAYEGPYDERYDESYEERYEGPYEGP